MPPWAERAFIPVFFIGAALLPLLLEKAGTPIHVSTLALAYVVMALGLNIIVGFAGLLDLGFVAFFAIGAYTMGWFGSDFFSAVNDGKGIHVLVSDFSENLAGIHLNFVFVAIAAIVFCDDRGHDHRPADAASARRLHRDRDAGFRRDHRPHRRQRRRRHHEALELAGRRRRCSRTGSAPTRRSPRADRASRRSTRSTSPASSRSSCSTSGRGSGSRWCWWRSRCS